MDDEIKAALEMIKESFKGFKGKYDSRMEEAESRLASLDNFSAKVNREKLGLAGGGGSFAPKDPLCFTHGQRLASEPSGISIGRMVKGMITGEWKDLDNEFKAASEGNSVGGGVLVSAPISAQILDQARNAMVLSAAGMKTVPMESSSLLFPVVTASAAASWVKENAAAPEDRKSTRLNSSH